MVALRLPTPLRKNAKAFRREVTLVDDACAHPKHRVRKLLAVGLKPLYWQQQAKYAPQIRISSSVEGKNARSLIVG